MNQVNQFNNFCKEYLKVNQRITPYTNASIIVHNDRVIGKGLSQDKDNTNSPLLMAIKSIDENEKKHLKSASAYIYKLQVANAADEHLCIFMILAFCIPTIVVANHQGDKCGVKYLRKQGVSVITM